jgi:hypothetical protein
MERRAPYLVKAELEWCAGPLVVGIDPGAVTGVAVWSVEAQELLHVGSGHFFDVLALLESRVPLGGVADGSLWPVGLVVVEDARRLPIYAGRDGLRGRRRDRVCRDVGRVDRDVELWEVWLRSRGLPVRLAEPLRGGKWDAATLEEVAGWAAPTNQHGRDAARLVFGTTERHLETWGVP